VPPNGRLPLPGARGVWWLLGIAAVALPIGQLALGSASSPRAASDAIHYKTRELNMMWRVHADLEDHHASQLQARLDHDNPQLAGAVTATDKSTRRRAEADKAIKRLAAAGLEQLRQKQALERRIIRDLFKRAEAIPPGPDHGRADAMESVVAHCLAAERYDLAGELGAILESPTKDMRVALAGAVPPSLARRLSKMSAQAASDAAHSSAYGRAWSRFTRDRIRAHLHGLAGHGTRAGRIHRRLHRERDNVFAAFNVLRIGVGIAALIGVFMFLAGIVRSRLSKARGSKPLAWLRDKHKGIDNIPRFHTDPLVPLLGLGGWLLGYALAAVAIALVPGERPPGGMAVLFQSMAGIVVTWAIVGAFSRTIPTFSAVRFLPEPDGPSPWSASTAALRAFCLLWPFMAVSLAITTLIFDQASQPHAVAQMLLDAPDPLTIVSLGVAVVIMAPIGEELFFRGFLQQVIRQRFGPAIAIAITALIFATVHMSPTFILLFATLSVAFSLVFEWVGSLWASIVLHGLWNACVLIYVLCVAFS